MFGPHHASQIPRAEAAGKSPDPHPRSPTSADPLQQKVRQDWSKETLYNLSRLTTPRASNRTFFQQKWTAKSLARAYHNPDVREGQWTRMFDRRLPAVVSMDHRYLASFDGSEQASGRGAGKDDTALTTMGRGGGGRDRPVRKTPYMHMTFYPMERRLDTAIWRALFASSVRQARQFVVHGWVKVNGRKMIYPGYQLNPGDMFSVEPERVMFATGAKKRKRGSPVSEQDGRDSKAEEERLRSGVKGRKEDLEEAEEAEDQFDDESDAGAATLESDQVRETMTTPPEEIEDPRKAMRNLVARAKRILEDSKRKLSGKRQQELRAFYQGVRKTIAKQRGLAADEAHTISDLEAGLAEILAKIPQDDVPKESSISATSVEAEANPSNPQAATSDHASRKDAELLAQALQRARENPMDVSKPYATPWKPREFMSAFAFIPRYLEVNQNICSAVYLRHPVARPGLAEVPTPFSAEVMGLAFNWYLRRR